MSCSFRLRTTRPDGRREDLPLDDLLDSPEFEDALLDGLKMNGLLDITETPDGEGGQTLSLKAKFKGFEPTDLSPGELLGLDGLLSLSPDGVDIEGNAKFALSTTLNDNPGVVTPITGEQLLGDLEYTESERVVEQVAVGTAPNQVVIDRMVSVTFVGPVGGSLRLIFDNPD